MASDDILMPCHSIAILFLAQDWNEEIIIILFDTQLFEILNPKPKSFRCALKVKIAHDPTYLNFTLYCIDPPTEIVKSKRNTKQGFSKA
jgi:hypothetical protein